MKPAPTLKEPANRTIPFALEIGIGNAAIAQIAAKTIKTRGRVGIGDLYTDKNYYRRPNPRGFIGPRDCLRESTGAATGISVLPSG